MVRAITQERTITAEVTGTDRYKYFRRPVTEIKDGSPTEAASRFPLLGLENVTSLGLLAPPTTAQKPPTRYAATQVQATQTDYRESEAQTIPWTPPYTARGDTTPEVLYLDQLSWGDGLPPGCHEVEVVERLRRKRAWESQLPPPDTQRNVNIRYKLIAEMERSDWKFREKEIEAVHRERMKKSEQLLEKHNLMNRSRLSTRMVFLQDDFNRRKEQKLQFIRHDKERALRKLCMREKGYDPKNYKMSVLDEQLRHTSELYAPMKRYGVSFRNRNETLAQKQFTIDAGDICDFAYTPSYRPVFDYNKASQPKKQTELCVRETRWTMDNLVKLHQDLQKLRAKTTKSDTLFAQVEQRPKPSEHAEVRTLTCAQRSLDEEKTFQAAMLIQRIIHSRSMQVMMEQKRVCWKELMQELKTSRLVDSELDISNYRDENILQTRMAGVLDNLIGLNVGTSIGQTLYLLATELLRFKNEGVAHSQALQAEAARWRRELPEEGRRQREMRRREEHNLMFAQLLEVYQDSINGFLEKLLLEARENEAKRRAYEHGKEVARLAELERLNQPEPEPEQPVSADLLFALIAPEGLRDLARTCLLILRQKYQEAYRCLQQNQGRVHTAGDESGREKEQTDHADGKHTSTIEAGALSDRVSKSRDSAVAELKLTSDTEGRTLSDRGSKQSRDSLVAEATPTEPVESQPQVPKDGVEILWSASSTATALAYGGEPSFVYSEVSEMVDSLMSSPEVAQCRQLGLQGAPEPADAEDRLLARVMRDMCYVAGSLLHTAANILNKAIQLAGIPQESFDEALRRTMLVIHGALEEVIGLILPKKPDGKQPVSEELIIEASRIVDDILQKAKQKIAEMKEEDRLKMDTSIDTESQAKALVEDVIKEAQHKVLRMIIEDFLTDLIQEATNKVKNMNKD